MLTSAVAGTGALSDNGKSTREMKRKEEVHNIISYSVKQQNLLGRVPWH